MAVSESEVRRQIQSRQAAPLYLLEGDDVQSRHELAHEFASLVDEELQAFNLQTFHANEATTSAARDQMISALLTAARTLPMMAPRRVIIVHQAEHLLAPRRSREDEEVPITPSKRGGRHASPAEDLEAYFQQPEPLTTLVFAAEELDAARRLVKVLRKNAVQVECGALQDPASAARWIKGRLEREKMAIEPAAIKRLLQATGLSLGRIRAAVDAVVLFAAGEAVISERHVHEAVPLHAEPEEGFVIGRAIWDGDLRRALKEIGAQLDAGYAPVQVLGQLRAAAGGLRPDERARRGLDAVLRTDLALKSSAGEARHHLERLAIELCAH